MNKIIEIALKEVGYTETPANSNKTKYGQWFGFDGVAWCAMFVSWCYAMANNPLGNIGFAKGFAGCQTAFVFFTKNKWIVPYSGAIAGDIVLYDWNGDGRYDHVGILKEKAGDHTFIAIEGNTSATNQSNGGQVQIRTRDIKGCVFAHKPNIENQI